MGKLRSLWEDALRMKVIPNDNKYAGVPITDDANDLANRQIKSAESGSLIDVEAISKITGMILGIGNINEIFDITTNPEHISSRIKEALELLEKSNQ